MPDTVRVRAPQTVHVPGHGLLREGAEADLDADAAKSLIAEGVVVAAPKAKPSEPKSTTKET